MAAWVAIVTCGCSDRATAPSRTPAVTSAASANHDPKATDAKPQTVELTIDYGDGSKKRFADIPWHEAMTVLDVLKAAKEHSHGISFSTRGSGEALMVTKIDDLANQWGATNGKNWIFHINGHMGDQSCAVTAVRPGDVVLWKFGPYE